MFDHFHQASRAGLAFFLVTGVALSAQAAPLAGPGTLATQSLQDAVMSPTQVQYQQPNPRYGQRAQRQGGNVNRGGRQVRRGGGNAAGAAVAAGVAGLVIGGIIASQNRPQRGYRTYEEPYQDRYQQHYQPVYQEPQYVQQGYGLTPWTQDWYDYCAQRYRSFDPRSGTFVSYDGRRYMCQ
jgi:hypothetical protein